MHENVACSEDIYDAWPYRKEVVDPYLKMLARVQSCPLRPQIVILRSIFSSLHPVLRTSSTLSPLQQGSTQK